VRTIPLTQGKEALVDNIDYAYLMRWKWYFNRRKDGSGYAARTDRHPRKRMVYMHVVVFLRKRKRKRLSGEVDHKNRDKLDNRRQNLRAANRSQTNYNKQQQKNNTSGYIGVALFKPCPGLWQSYINVDRKRIPLGYWKSKKAAARAYNRAARKYHGKFAVLNNVKPLF
jgi:hypothetical protein